MHIFGSMKLVISSEMTSCIHIICNLVPAQYRVVILIFDRFPFGTVKLYINLSQSASEISTCPRSHNSHRPIRGPLKSNLYKSNENFVTITTWAVSEQRLPSPLIYGHFQPWKFWQISSQRNEGLAVLSESESDPCGGSRNKSRLCLSRGRVLS